MELNLSALGGERLDIFLTTHLSSSVGALPPSRSAIQEKIRQDGAIVNGKVVLKASFLLKSGDTVQFFYRESFSPEELTPYQFPLNILFEDEYLMVINKPHGLAVHPGTRTGGKTLLNALVAYSEEYRQLVAKNIGTSMRPGIVHRLDRDTSGILVVAKKREVTYFLSTQFRDKSVNRRYLALVATTLKNTENFKEESGTIDFSIGRSPINPRLFTTTDFGARGIKSATTYWSVKERFRYGKLLDIKLGSGRTHQIRVHCDAVGAPVIGDRTYGVNRWQELLPKNLQLAAVNFGRQALHAYLLEFNHPLLGRMSFKAEVPDDLKRLIEEFRE